MKTITRLMIDEYNLTNIDFMGYTFNKHNASYHHLIVPKRLGGPETIENGAILNSKTSHPYLHVVEAWDFDLFTAITQEIIEEKALGRLDKDCITRIDCLLDIFEKEYYGLSSGKGKLLIKDEYIRGRKGIRL